MLLNRETLRESRKVCDTGCNSIFLVEGRVAENAPKEVDGLLLELFLELGVAGECLEIIPTQLIRRCVLDIAQDHLKMLSLEEFAVLEYLEDFSLVSGIIAQAPELRKELWLHEVLLAQDVEDLARRLDEFDVGLTSVPERSKDVIFLHPSDHLLHVTNVRAVRCLLEHLDLLLDTVAAQNESLRLEVLLADLHARRVRVFLHGDLGDDIFHDVAEHVKLLIGELFELLEWLG